MFSLNLTVGGSRGAKRSLLCTWLQGPPGARTLVKYERDDVWPEQKQINVCCTSELYTSVHRGKHDKPYKRSSQETSWLKRDQGGFIYLYIYFSLSSGDVETIKHS